eukprot:jgi/Galph1/1699/GphlegSOOS_G368.1
MDEHVLSLEKKQAPTATYGTFKSFLTVKKKPRWLITIIRHVQKFPWWWRTLLYALIFLFPSLLAAFLWKLISLEMIHKLMKCTILWFLENDSPLDSWSKSQRLSRQIVWYSLLYVLLALLCFPASIFTMGAGVLFGPWLGAAVAILCLCTVALIAFSLARFLFSAFFYDVTLELFSNEWLQLYDELSVRRGFLLTFLIRSSPIFPFAVCSYFLGIMQVSITKFLIATSLGILPEVIFLTHFGSLANSLVDIVTNNHKAWSRHQWYLLVSGSAVSFVVIIIITSIAKRTLQRLKSQENEQSI